ncbi:MAG: site-specific DNA-methyltransferase, partial [Anaerolineae bacterium]
MPTLNWIGKEAVINHHKEVPFRLLNCDPTLSVGEPNGNLLIEGDNLEALKALLPYYAGQVKCIYIDPPYNTGNESWVYNDNVNSPQIRAWLGKVVGGEGEDLSRHDKWLCMMYPRLRLLWELLSDEGSLWMSIDDNEIHHARAILDEIFGEHNFVANVIWEKSYAPKSSARHLSDRHEHVLLYAKQKDSWQRNLLPRTEQQDRLYKNPDNDPRGPWRPNNLAARNYYSLGTYSIKCPGGRIIPGPPKGSYWRVSEERLWDLDREGRRGKDGNNVPAPKIYLSEVKQGLVPETIWFYKDVDHSQEGKKEILRLLPDAGEVFSTPKPTRLIQRILQIATNPGDIVLDSFAGSGTTGHAALQLNKEDGGDRRFILVELESEIARNITAERLRRVIQGYT